MRAILVIGAGKSTSQLIQYLLSKAATEQLQVILGDISLENAQRLINGHEQGIALKLDVFDEKQRKAAIQKADIVISMLPARFHIEVAKDCVTYGKSLVTASYVSKEMQALDPSAKEKGLVLMNEIGNLWNYKFTWNPRNVVLAGQGGAAEFIQEGSYKYIPYQRLFRRTEFLNVEGYGRFEGYANRNSLKYRSIYGLEDVLTLYRGTIRRVGFSKAWHIFVMMGMTDDSYMLEQTETMSYRDFINLFLPYSPTDSVELKLRHYLKIDQDDLLWDKLEELNLFSPDKKIGLKKATPAQCLQRILEDQWTLAPEDKDMIVMYHKFGYEYKGERKQIDATMVNVGSDQINTAMARTVGLPVAIATLAILNGKIKTPGVQVPIKPEVYNPILDELENYGIVFKEYDVPYLGYNPDNVGG